MPWQALATPAFAVAIHTFNSDVDGDLPLRVGDDIYIFEVGGDNGEWLRGYIFAPPSIEQGLTAPKGKALEPVIYHGVFPRNCVRMRDPDFAERRMSTQRLSDMSYELDFSQKFYGVDSNRPTSNGETYDLKVLDIVRDENAPKPPLPAPYVRIGEDTAAGYREPLIDEIASCLKEWHYGHLHRIILERQYDVLWEVERLRTQLIEGRNILLNNTHTEEELQKLRDDIVWDMIRGNKLITGEVIVRNSDDNGRIMTGDDLAVDMAYYQVQMSCLNDKPKVITEATELHHLSVDFSTFVRQFQPHPTETTTLLASLMFNDTQTGVRPLSDTFSITIPSLEVLAEERTTLEAKLKKLDLQSLFTDLTASDVGIKDYHGDLFLAIRITQTERVYAPKNGSISDAKPKESMSSHTSDRPPVQQPAPKGTRMSVMGWKIPGSKGAKHAQKMQPYPEAPSAAESITSFSSNASGSTNEHPTTPSRVVTRTLGVGVMPVGAIVKEMNEEIDSEVRIWTPMRGGIDPAWREAKEYEPLLKEIIDSPNRKYAPAEIPSVKVQFRPFRHADAGNLVGTTPGLLSNVRRCTKIGFPGAPTTPRNDIYITFEKANFPFQAMLSKQSNASTVMPRSLLYNNVYITAEVRTADSRRIEDAFWYPNKGETATVWESTAVDKNQSWNETISLNLAPEIVKGAHLLINIFDAPRGQFALAYMPLYAQNAFQHDGRHSLLIYKLEDQHLRASPEGKFKGGYMTAPWDATSTSNKPKDASLTAPLATLNLNTKLVSTKMSQNQVLVGVLAWKDQPDSAVINTLRNLPYVPEIEIVTSISQVFDALFQILVEHADNETFEDLVLKNLVHVLTIAYDRRFADVAPVVDRYAEQQFQFPFATPCLVRALIRLLNNPTDGASAMQLRQTFKVFRQIFKFITHGRGQQIVKEADIGITNGSPGFKRDLQRLFKALEKMMKDDSASLIGSQTLAVQYFADWLPELTAFFTGEEISHIAIDFMDSCAELAHKKKNLALYRLVLLVKYAKLECFRENGPRSALAANTVRWIDHYWGKTHEPITEQWRAQVRLCCSVVRSQIEFIGTEIPLYVPKIVDAFTALRNRNLQSPPQHSDDFATLWPTKWPFEHHKKDTKPAPQFDESMVELSALMVSFSQSTAGLQLDDIECDMASFLDDLLHMQQSVLDNEAYPEAWISLLNLQFRAAIDVLELTGAILIDQFVPSLDSEDPSDLNVELWNTFFMTILKIINSGVLAIEASPEQKRRVAWQLNGDVRSEAAELLLKTWDALGWPSGWTGDDDEEAYYNLANFSGNQTHFSPSLIPNILELILSGHEQIRGTGIYIFYTMLASEWKHDSSLNTTTTAALDALDTLFKKKRFSEDVLRIPRMDLVFQHTLAGLLSQDASAVDAWNEHLTILSNFIEHLYLVYSTETSDKASSLADRLKLMQFLREIGKDDIYIKYCHELSDALAEKGDYKESGLALRLHADLYDWSTATFTEAIPSLSIPLPAQTKFERKERLYFSMIESFEKASAWGCALAAYEELAAQYATNSYDYRKLARTQNSMATTYTRISDEGTSRPYFMVEFHGLGFQPQMRDRAFVYEGDKDESKRAFLERLQGMYPAAKFIREQRPELVEGQYVTVEPVTVYHEFEHDVFRKLKVGHNIREHVLSSNTRRFAFVTERQLAGPADEQGLVKLVLETEDEFPNIARRSVVTRSQSVVIGAVEAALERVVRKTYETYRLAQQIKDDGDESKIGMVLNIIYEAVSPDEERSVARYLTLLHPRGREFDAEDGENEATPVQTMTDPLVPQLRVAMLDQTICLRSIIASFADSPHLALRNSYSVSKSAFEATYAEQLASLSPISMPSQSGFTTQFLPAQMVFEPTSVAAAQHIQSVGYPHIDDSPIDFQNPGRSDTFASVLTYRGAEGRPPMTADSGKTEPPVRSSRLEFFHRPKRDKSAKDGDGKAQPQKKQRGRPPVAMKTNGFSAHNSGANSREESRQSRRSSSRRRSISHFFKGEEPGSEGGEKGRKRDTAIFTPEGKIETTIGGGRPSTAGTGMSRAKSVRKRASEAIMGIGIKGKRGVESRG